MACLAVPALVTPMMAMGQQKGAAAGPASTQLLTMAKAPISSRWRQDRMMLMSLHACLQLQQVLHSSLGDYGQGARSEASGCSAACPTWQDELQLKVREVSPVISVPSRLLDFMLLLPDLEHGRAVQLSWGFSTTTWPDTQHNIAQQSLQSTCAK